ncbi:zinc metalloprotease [Paraburkholderia sediminicola]|uniref:hypothetical protein n=1 Tax=Paraburkholderia sediminicola TaxID=458836 RepID=UPI0038BBF0C0
MTKRIILGLTLSILSKVACSHDLEGLAHDKRMADAFQSSTSGAAGGTPGARKDAAIDIAQKYTVEGSGLQSAQIVQVQGVIIRAKTLPNHDGAVKICFYGGAAATRQAIMHDAVEWTHYGNIAFDFGQLPQLRDCAQNDAVPIRVSFDGKGLWSYIGTDAKYFSDRNQPTLNLEGFDNIDPNSDHFRDTVLHEFGHALGFQHEHQSPLSDCEKQFNMAAIKDSTGWTDKMVSDNFTEIKVSMMIPLSNGFIMVKTPDGQEIDITAYDPKSIMHYSLPSIDFYPPPGSCYIPQNHGLSQQDKATMQYAYPYVAKTNLQSSNNNAVKSLQGVVNNYQQINILNSLLK